MKLRKLNPSSSTLFQTLVLKIFPVVFCVGFASISMGGEKWATAVSKKGERAVVFRYADAFSPGFKRETLPYRIIVQWKYETKSGMPAAEQLAAMDRFEDLVSPGLRKEQFSTLVLVSTGENLREWIYYARSEKEFLARLNAALQGHPSLPVQIHADRDEGWSTYEKFWTAVKR